jgi:hypothetical protein
MRVQCNIFLRLLVPSSSSSFFYRSSEKEKMTIQYEIQDENRRVKVFRCSNCTRIGEKDTVCKQDRYHGFIENAIYDFSYMLDRCSTCDAHFANIKRSRHCCDSKHTYNRDVLTLENWMKLSSSKSSIGEQRTLSSINEEVNKQCDTYMEKLKDLCKIFPDMTKCTNITLEAKSTLEKARSFSNSIPPCEEKETLEEKIPTLQVLVEKTERMWKLFTYMSDDKFLNKLDKIGSMVDDVDVSL